ncbi:unnamed protein product [Ectocarpus fasciculatus]
MFWTCCRNLTSLDRETKAFKSVMEEKARMTIPVRTTTSFLPAERTARDGNVTRLSTPLAEAGKRSSSGNASSRRGGRRKAQAPLRVVVTFVSSAACFLTCCQQV